MNGVLVDSNIIIDIITDNPTWSEWSSNKLSEYVDSYPIYINKIIYSEVSMGYERIEETETALPNTIFRRATIPWEAAFLAGKAFIKYRRNGGNKSQPLPDFFIGAHASVANLVLLTRDPRRYKQYFPKLKIISPEHVIM